MDKDQLAPVVLFVYGRPNHTKKTINALLLNPESSFTDLIIYSDGARDIKDVSSVNAVRKIINSIEGFKSITVIEHEENHGLANNIINGVTEVCNKYGKIIVLEDDIITSVHFLRFMNKVLNEYEDCKKIWHISGWNYPLDLDIKHPEAFLWRTMNCWGWATWSDRWMYFKKDPEDLIQTWTKESIDKFNLDRSYDFWSQITDNYNKKINTWAVFWYATIFSHDGLCLNPTASFVTNIGHDGSGENCGSKDIYRGSLSNSEIVRLPTILEEDCLVVDEIKAFYKARNPSAIRIFLGKIKRMFI